MRNKVRRSIRVAVRNYWRIFGHPIDRYNIRKYGSDAPKYAELIYVNPQLVKGVLLMPWHIARRESGTVVDKFPPHEGSRILYNEDIPKINACLEHWVHGVEWEKTTTWGKYLKGDDETPRRKDWDIKAWSAYDKLIKEIVFSGRLKTRRELYPNNFREEGGVLVHLDGDGNIYHGNAGNRRFAAAVVAGLELIPAMVGYVHVDALDTFKQLRKGLTRR